MKKWSTFVIAVGFFIIAVSQTMGDKYMYSLIITGVIFVILGLVLSFKNKK